MLYQYVSIFVFRRSNNVNTVDELNRKMISDNFGTRVPFKRADYCFEIPIHERIRNCIIFVPNAFNCYFTQVRTTIRINTHCNVSQNSTTIRNWNRNLVVSLWLFEHPLLFPITDIVLLSASARIACTAHDRVFFGFNRNE